MGSFGIQKERQVIDTINKYSGGFWVRLKASTAGKIAELYNSLMIAGGKWTGE